MTIDHARNKKLFGIKSSCWENAIWLTRLREALAEEGISVK